jgi:hypothetical protein
MLTRVAADAALALPMRWTVARRVSEIRLAMEATEHIMFLSDKGMVRCNAAQLERQMVQHAQRSDERVSGAC